MGLSAIDIGFDFTSDTPDYWNGFWDYRDGLGGSDKDPDSLSPTLREYHRLLWSKELPNGQVMELSDDTSQPYGYLKWNGMRFGSDSITATFRYGRYREVIDRVAAGTPNYRAFVEGCLHRLYTIGGMIIFPKNQVSMNRARGMSKKVSDRWDLTLECIRRHYMGGESPLSTACAHNADFFELFVDFEGYIDFFLLQDCIDPETGGVRFWLGDGDFDDDPRPKDVPEYLRWVQSQIDFVEARNARIAAWVSENA